MKTKRRLRREIKIGMIVMISWLMVWISLKSLNNRLEVVIRFEELEVEDLYIQNQNALKTPQIPLCSNSSAKTYMDYRKITSEESRQYKFIRSEMTIKDGLLVDRDGRIGVALGSAFGEIGTKWTFVLNTGVVLDTIKIEEKSDRHTINGCEHRIDGSVIEFVIDPLTIKYWIGSNGLILNGNFNNHIDFAGEIVEIRKEVK